MENKNHHNGFGNGFILGLLIGVIVTLVVTTKRGRQLFKEFTDKGLDKFSDLEKKLQETSSNAESFDEFDSEDDYVREASTQVQEEPAKEIRQVTKLTHHVPNGNDNRKPQRFFRQKKN